jgi:hypothetical protein
MCEATQSQTHGEARRRATRDTHIYSQQTSHRELARITHITRPRRVRTDTPISEKGVHRLYYMAMLPCIRISGWRGVMLCVLLAAPLLERCRRQPPAERANAKARVHHHARSPLSHHTPPPGTSKRPRPSPSTAAPSTKEGLERALRCTRRSLHG